jgi:hypothetical protein
MVPDARKENPLNNQLILAPKVTRTSITITTALLTTPLPQQALSPITIVKPDTQLESQAVHKVIGYR